MIKAGVLYPQSHIYPLIGSDLLDGIRCSLEEHKCEEISLQTEAIGFGTNEKDIYHKVEKLLLADQVDVVIGYVDPRLAKLLQPLFTATEKLFIVVNTGANYPPNWAPPPGTIYLSLLDSFLCRLTGKLAFTNGFDKAFFTASFYDGGYLHTATMVNGYLSAGGTILYNYISPQKSSEFDLTPLLNQLATIKEPIALFSLFSGEEAGLFTNAIEKKQNITIFCSPLMLEEQNFNSRISNHEMKCSGHIAWHSSLASVENEIFLRAFRVKAKRSASIFSLLGWETGMILNAAKGLIGQPADRIVEHLCGQSYQSPRGKALIDKATHFFLPAAWCFTSESPGKMSIQQVDDLQRQWEEFVNSEKEVPASGWNNTYPCY